MNKGWAFKKILSIGLVLVFIVSVFSLIVPNACATVTKNMGGYAYVPVVNDTYEVLIGEELRFNTTGDQIIGKSPDSIAGLLFGQTSNASNYCTSDYMSEEGIYTVTNTSTSATLKLSVTSPMFGFKIKDESGTDTISTLIKNGNFTVDITGNLPSDDVIDLVIINPKGYQFSADPTGNVFLNQTIEAIEGYIINTAGWPMGTYDISVETKQGYARGLDLKVEPVKQLTSGSPEIIVSSESIDIEVVNQEISTQDDIIIKGTTTGNPDKVVLVLCSEDIAAYLEVNLTDNSIFENISATDWNWYNKKGAVTGFFNYTPGTYSIYAVHPMGDGITRVESHGQPTHPPFQRGMEYIADRGCYGIESLYQLEISDDVSALSEVTIKYPYFNLDPIDAVVIPGEDFNISGITNRVDGTQFEVTVTSVGVWEKRISTVLNGSIDVEFNTTEWPWGIDYLVTVRDEKNTILQEEKFNVGYKTKIAIVLEVIPETVNVGESVKVRATAKQMGVEQESLLISIKLDGNELKSKNVTLGPGETEIVEYTFTATKDMVGTHSIETNQKSVTLTVNKVENDVTSTTPEESMAPTQTPTDKEPGFEVSFAIAGLLIVSYLVLRRKIK